MIGNIVNSILKKDKENKKEKIDLLEVSNNILYTAINDINETTDDIRKIISSNSNFVLKIFNNFGKILNYPVFLTDIKGNILYYNDEVKKIFSKKNLENNNIFDILKSFDKTKISNNYSGFDVLKNYYFRIFDDDKEIYCKVKHSSFYFGDKKYMFFIIEKKYEYETFMENLEIYKINKLIKSAFDDSQTYAFFFLKKDKNSEKIINYNKKFFEFFINENENFCLKKLFENTSNGEINYKKVMFFIENTIVFEDYIDLNFINENKIKKAYFKAISEKISFPEEEKIILFIIQDMDFIRNISCEYNEIKNLKYFLNQENKIGKWKYDQNILYIKYQENSFGCKKEEKELLINETIFEKRFCNLQKKPITFLEFKNFIHSDDLFFTLYCTETNRKISFIKNSNINGIIYIHDNIENQI